jgi:hypothetical protein
MFDPVCHWLSALNHTQGHDGQGCPQGGPLRGAPVRGCGNVRRVSWERALLELFDELEVKAEGLAQESRDDDVADLARVEYAEVTLADRLHGAVGTPVVIHAAGDLTLTGRLERVGRGCAAVLSADHPRGLQVVNADHVLSVVSTSQRAMFEPARGVTSRLGLASAIRHLAEEVHTITVRLSDGRRVVGDLRRVGADFVELVPEAEVAPAPLLVPLPAVVTVGVA